MIDIPFDQFVITFLIDDTTIESYHPGSEPFSNYVTVPRRVGAYNIQRAFYSGYFRDRSLKFQMMFLPNGLYGSVWGDSQSYNNSGVLNMSGLVDYLYSILEPTPTGHLPWIR